jgi:hypothetical protein
MQHPKFKIDTKCGWFYIIQLSHNGKWGFGITLNVDSRLRKGYCNPSAEKQVFSYLYYGKYSQITALERHLKNQWKDKLLVLYDEKLEWFDPKKNVDGERIVEFVEDRCRAVYSEIYRVKKDHLPFSPSKIFKGIKDEPEKFLEHM